jgi:hypothetical protein
MLTLGRHYSMDELRRANVDAGGYWFSPSTMRFFSSRVSSEVVPVADGWLFVSSEEGPSGVRRYTIRKMDQNANIDTVGEFQQFASRSGAVRAMRAMR